MRTAVISDSFSGRSINLHVNSKQLDSINNPVSSRWEWLTDYQRKKIESFFGKTAAYYTTIEFL